MIVSKAASQPASSKCMLVELPRVVGDTSFDGDAGVIGRVADSSAAGVCLDLKGNTRALECPEQSCDSRTAQIVVACMEACA